LGVNLNLYLHAYTPCFPGLKWTRTPRNPRDWQEIAADAGKETDPKKLNKLVDELLEALAEERRQANEQNVDTRPRKRA
jgi:hypothetical protein